MVHGNNSPCTYLPYCSPFWGVEADRGIALVSKVLAVTLAQNKKMDGTFSNFRNSRFTAIWSTLFLFVLHPWGQLTYSTGLYLVPHSPQCPSVTFLLNSSVFALQIDRTLHFKKGFFWSITYKTEPEREIWTKPQCTPWALSMTWTVHIALYLHVHHMQSTLGQKYLQNWVAFSALCDGVHLRKLLQIAHIQYQPYDNTVSADGATWWIWQTVLDRSLCTGGRWHHTEE